MRNRALVRAVVLMVTLAGTALSAGQRGAGPGPGGAQAPAVGLIVGRVVDAVTGQPVAEAEVTVAMRAPAAPAVPGGVPGAGPMNVRLLTGADGRFVVRDLPAGNVQLSARASGYLMGNQGQARPGGPSSPVQITADKRVVTAAIRLWKHAVVTGMVTDERNEPAINVTVRVMGRTFRNGQARLGTGGIGRTDDRGMYRVAGLAPGDYVVAVPQTQSTMPAALMDEVMQGAIGGQGFSPGVLELAASGMAQGGGLGVRVGDQLVASQSGALPVLSGDGRMAAYLTQYHPAASSPADATVVTLAPGEERGGIDIRMPLVPTWKVSGTVLGPDGPLANVPVRLLNAADADAPDMFSDVARSATAANGSFQVFGVPAGQYVVKVLRQGRQPLPATVAANPQLAALMGGRGGPVSPSDALTLFADVPLSVERDVTDLNITLSTGATVSGRIEFVGTSAIPPFTGFNVSLVPLGGSAQPTRPAQVGEDGRFTLAGSPAGKYFINTTARTDGPGWFVKSAMVNGIDALDQPFELTTENIGNVVVTFTDRRTTVSGSVMTSGGVPAEATVIVFPADHREWIAKGMSLRLMRNLRTQAKGAFSIAGLPARDYLIIAVADDQLPDVQNPAAYDALARAATSFSLSEGETRTLSIRLAQVVR